MTGLLPNSLTGLPPDMYATDEDVALRASTDFVLLCPADQKLAYGTDGVFYPSDLWTLTSASVNFLANSLSPNQIARLSKPATAFQSPGELLAVATVAAGGITLRRKGQTAGTGQPPSPSTGLAGVEFTVATLAPQIARASYDLNRRYGIDDLVAGRTSNDLYDPQEVRDVTVLTVLHMQYLAAGRGETINDSFAAKARVIKDELDDLLARVVIHWKPASDPSMISPSTTKFSTRITR